MNSVRGHPLRRILSISGALALFLSGVTAVAASAVEPVPDSEGMIIFQAEDVSVEITAGVATAINRCVVDAADGFVIEAANYCNQLASAGNLVETGSIVISQSSDVSVTVSGGLAEAINQCINDAVDGIVETQLNACEQSANAQTLVLVESISITSSEKVRLSIDGGTATAVNSCIDLIENGTVTEQINACSQAATAFTVVQVGDILIEDSQKVKIRISGGKAQSVVECVTSVVDGTAGEQRNDCTYTTLTGDVVTIGTISVLASDKIKIKVEGSGPKSLRQCIEYGADGVAQDHPSSCSKAKKLRKKARKKHRESELFLQGLQGQGAQDPSLSIPVRVVGPVAVPR
ncbi:MAG: hypothetical protein QG608_2411 [Actinomycetota bacterium]|nr:hypothetical protein [Actinomycetota bacterium]